VRLTRLIQRSAVARAPPLCETSPRLMACPAALRVVQLLMTVRGKEGTEEARSDAVFFDFSQCSLRSCFELVEIMPAQLFSSANGTVAQATRLRQLTAAWICAWAAAHAGTARPLIAAEALALRRIPVLLPVSQQSPDTYRCIEDGTPATSLDQNSHAENASPDPHCQLFPRTVRTETACNPWQRRTRGVSCA